MTSEFLCGIHAVRSFFRTRGGKSLRLLLKSGNLGPRLREIADEARSLGCEIEFCQREQLDAVTSNHQGVVLYIESSSRSRDLLEDLIEETATGRIFLVLDEVTDPRNLGACIRSAATLGVTAVIASRSNSAPLNAAAVKASSGGVDITPYYQVPNISRVLDELKKLGYWVIGTVLEGGKPLAQVDLTGNLVLVVGSEGKGLRRITRESCDFFATIPMLDKSLGFNVSVATGICLYEIQRQRELAT